MKVEIRIPQMGESISQVTISKIFKPSGSSVRLDEELVEIETDKLNQALYASAKGIVTLNVKEGDTVKVGQIIGFIEQGGKEEGTDKPAMKEEKVVHLSQPMQKTEPSVRVSTDEWAATLQQEPVKKELLSDTSESVSMKAHKDDSRGEKVVKMSTVRKVIAERMLQVKRDTAMLTTFNEVDMSHVISLRERYKEEFIAKWKVKLGFMSFFVKACSLSLIEFPQVNSYIEGDFLKLRNYIDISIAVSTEKGLVVPVLRDCDQCTFAQIEKKIDDFAIRAQNGNLTVDELVGGGFTITNGGVFGSLLSTPLLNPPQCAILGMHKITQRAVVVNNEIVIRPMMYLALSYDHRIIDGKEAVKFLVHVKECIEDPDRLILEL